MQKKRLGLSRGGLWGTCFIREQERLLRRGTKNVLLDPRGEEGNCIVNR